MTFNSSLLSGGYDETQNSSVVPASQQPKETGWLSSFQNLVTTLTPIAQTVIAAKEQKQVRQSLNEGAKTATPVAGVPTATPSPGVSVGGMQLNTSTLIIGGGVLLLGVILLMRKR